MKQLVILSGKGGTGKTSVAAAFAHLAYLGKPRLRAILADADVDAANLELILRPRLQEAQDFTGGSIAVIDEAKCQVCGICAEVCRFAAITQTNGWQEGVYRVDPVACEGCAACVHQCPEGAIKMIPQTAGRWFRSEGRYGPLLHAELFPAQENSGKLVTMVKQQARLSSLDTNADLVIVDGPPGIGCPVISAAAGADLALIVAEPTAAGIHDMERVVSLASHFFLPCLVGINKMDIYLRGSQLIKQWCRANQIPVAGSIPFDPAIPRAMVHGEPVTAYQPESPASQAIIKLWERVLADLFAVP